MVATTPTAALPTISRYPSLPTLDGVRRSEGYRKVAYDGVRTEKLGPFDGRVVWVPGEPGRAKRALLFWKKMRIARAGRSSALLARGRPVTFVMGKIAYMLVSIMRAEKLRTGQKNGKTGTSYSKRPGHFRQASNLPFYYISQSSMRSSPSCLYTVLVSQECLQPQWYVIYFMIWSP